MTQPAKRIPTWLTIDLLGIAIPLAIIGIGIVSGLFSSSSVRACEKPKGRAKCVCIGE